jgi:hypothetical protein
MMGASGKVSGINDYAGMIGHELGADGQVALGRSIFQDEGAGFDGV